MSKELLVKLNSIALFIFLLCGCSSSNDQEQQQLRKDNLQGEYIYRQQGESLFSYSTLEIVNFDPYPWEQQSIGKHPRLTKEFFRCKGTTLNPSKVVQKKEEQIRYFDCGGAEKHSLPLKDGKEFVYPILIELLNAIQAETGKKVIVTSGHRCPDHHAYVDPASFNKGAKHMIGAQVSFYVQGAEDHPEAIIALLMEFYKKNPRYRGIAAFEEFKRDDKHEADISTPPWFNKEIFIKLYKRGEGRDFDQRHPYSYISIQVRFDRDVNEQVNYSWDKAQRYYRW